MIIIEIRAFRAHLRRFKGQKRRRCNERDESRVERRGEGEVKDKMKVGMLPTLPSNEVSATL